MKYKLLLYFLIIGSAASSQSWNKKIDSVYQAVDRQSISSTIKSYKVIFSFLNRMSYDDAIQKCKELKTKSLLKDKGYFEHFLAGQYLAWFYTKKDKKKGVAEYYSLIKTIPKMNKEEQAYAFFYAGKYHLAIGMSNFGAKYLLKAIDTFKLTGNQLMLFHIHFTLGDTYFKNQLFKESIDEMHKALSCYLNIEKNKKRTGSPSGKLYLSTLNTIALAYEESGQPDSAQMYYKRAKQIATELNNDVWKNIINANMGHIYIIKKMFDSAERVFKNSERINIQHNQTNDAINDMIRLAQVYLLTGRLDSSEAKLKFCKQYALLHNQPLPKIYYKVSSELNEKTGNLKKALKYLKRYHFMEDSIKNIVLSKKMNKISLEYSLDKKRLKLREMEIRNKLDSNKIKRQFFVILGFVLFSTTLIILLVFYLRNRKNIKALNLQLRTANKKLKSSNKELNSTLQSLKTMQAQLIQNEKMASLGILTSGIAHEINNPLNFIMGAYVGLNKFFNRHDINEKEKEKIELFLKSIDQGIKRITHIVRGLNQFSRNNSNFNETCNIHSILDNCIFLLNNKFKHKINVKKEYATEPIIIKGNTGKLHQAFFNILLNSSQAIISKGIISIKTIKAADNVIVTIKDNGCGISEEDKKRIMVPFFTTKAPGEGVGLGLSISHSIIKEHKGTIVFDSEKGQGTTVKILLPLKNNKL